MKKQIEEINKRLDYIKQSTDLVINTLSNTLSKKMTEDTEKREVIVALQLRCHNYINKTKQLIANLPTTKQIDEEEIGKVFYTITARTNHKDLEDTLIAIGIFTNPKQYVENYLAQKERIIIETTDKYIIATYKIIHNEDDYKKNKHNVDIPLYADTITWTRHTNPVEIMAGITKDEMMAL